MRINDVTPALPRAALISLAGAALQVGVSVYDAEFFTSYLLGRAARRVAGIPETESWAMPHKALLGIAKEAAAIVEEARQAVLET